MTKPNLPPDAFATATGAACYITRPQDSEILIRDIAIALSRIPRFGGHTLRPYSVAAHCLQVSDLLPYRLKLAGLLHDASEAYLGDVIGPLKHVLAPVYGPIEAAWQAKIARRFGLEPGAFADPLVKLADETALQLERRANLTQYGEIWPQWGWSLAQWEYAETQLNLPSTVDTWSGPDLVVERFLRRFEGLR